MVGKNGGDEIIETLLFNSDNLTDETNLIVLTNV
jgi:hypothetical protein